MQKERVVVEGDKKMSRRDFLSGTAATVVMGNLTIRLPEQKLEWDGVNMKVTNVAEANKYVRNEYRSGWSL